MPNSVAEQLIHAWLDSPDVRRVTNDDDQITPTARMRPTTDLARAAAVCLQGFGYVTPIGDGSYLVHWRADQPEETNTPVVPDIEDGGCDVCDDPNCYRNRPEEPER